MGYLWLSKHCNCLCVFGYGYIIECGKDVVEGVVDIIVWIWFGLDECVDFGMHGFTAELLILESYTIFIVENESS